MLASRRKVSAPGAGKHICSGKSSVWKTSSEKLETKRCDLQANRCSLSDVFALRALANNCLTSQNACVTSQHVIPACVCIMASPLCACFRRRYCRLPCLGPTVLRQPSLQQLQCKLKSGELNRHVPMGVCPSSTRRVQFSLGANRFRCCP